MTNNISYLSIFLLIIITFASCAKEETAITENYFIADELQPYFDRFVTAGLERGYQIDLAAAKIEGFLSLISDSGVVGQCQFDENSPHTIRIDKRYWNNATELEKEYVVFHELGHCYLERLHRDESNTNGTCVSLMESGLGECRANYRASTRADYLDELFE